MQSFGEAGLGSVQFCTRKAKGGKGMQGLGAGPCGGS